MRHLFCVALLASFFASALPARAQNVQARVHKLENGLELILVPRPGDPNIAAGWVAKVGSVNERPGITGTAHLFEHMMFKGTHTIGTNNIKRDLEVIAQLDAVKAKLAKEESKLALAHQLGAIDDPRDPKNRSETHQKLLVEFKDLLTEQKKVIVKDEFDRIYSSAGASGMNAGTTNDFTIYFINVPANKIELWFWMESDRLYNPVFREFYSERDVVREERRLRVESTPTGKFNEQFDALFWGSSPYSWPVIGWPSDVEAITRDEALEFFGTYYAPGNLTACLVGDFDPDNAVALAEKYFGRIPAGKKDVPEVRTREVEQLAEKRMSAEAPTNPQVTIRYHTVAHGHPDEAPLDVLASILNGRTGRLYKELVEGKKVANAASASHRSSRYDGYFALQGIAKPESTPESLEKTIHDLIDKMAEEAVTDRELQKVKNQEAANDYRKLRTNFNLLVELLVREAYLSWETINTDPKRLQAVTTDDLKRVVKKYFRKENRNVLIFHTKEEEGDKPTFAELFAELSEEEQAKLTTIKTQMAAALPEQLKAQLQQLQGALGSGAVPPAQVKLMKAFIALLEETLNPPEPKADSGSAENTETKKGGE